MKSTPLEQDKHSGGKEERFETDAQRIVRRHLENENDVITDEDLRSVRVGVDPDDEPAIIDEEIRKAKEILQDPG